MTNNLNSLLREDHNLHFTNFTNPDTMMEDKKGGNNNGNKSSLLSLKKELQENELTIQEALKTVGGGNQVVENNKWKTHCGGIVPS
jgi:hypothetical protein